MSVFKGVFGRVEFREEGKKMRENEEENFLENVWLGGGDEKEMVGLKCFLPGSTKSFLPTMGRKRGGGGGGSLIGK